VFYIHLAGPVKSQGGNSGGARERYRVGTLEKGLSVLEALDRDGRPLRIQQVAAATRIGRGTVFRLLCTLERCGYVERLPDKRFRATLRRRRTWIGYSAPLSGTPFRRDVTAGIQRAAGEAGVELVMLNSSEDRPQEDLGNVQVFLDSRVDLVILFQPVDSIAHVLADRLISAGLPVIAVETPIPGAVFFGGNDYKAGLMAGQALGRFTRQAWNSAFERLILIESSLTAPASQARLTGTVEGVREILGEVPGSRIVHLDGHAHRDTSRAAIAEVLDALSRRSRLLISAFNDPSAIGALYAIRSARLENCAAIVGQNATAESRAEIAKLGSPLIASVAYFPENYGEKLIRLALAMLNREQAPLAVYTDHVLLDRHNLERYYPQAAHAGARLERTAAPAEARGRRTGSGAEGPTGARPHVQPAVSEAPAQSVGAKPSRRPAENAAPAGSARAELRPRPAKSGVRSGVLRGAKRAREAQHPR
jgi:ribose transport system substrate-binding protein